MGTYIVVESHCSVLKKIEPILSSSSIVPGYGGDLSSFGIFQAFKLLPGQTAGHFDPGKHFECNWRTTESIPGIQSVLESVISTVPGPLKL